MKKWGCLALVLLVILGGAGGLVWKKREDERRWKWAVIRLPEAFARVPEAWKVETLAERLEKSHKIRDRPTFLEAAAQVGLQNVAPGGYLLPPRAGPLELAQAFKNGPTHQKVTFPEGFTALQIVARLQKNKFQNAQALQNAAYPPGRFSPLEGRLFPETYFLPLRGAVSALTSPLQARFQQTVKALPQPFPTVAGKHLTLSQVVILASLVEREAARDDERALIAGVLLHRLNIGMKLQCDATVQYAHILAAMNPAAHTTRVLLSDLEIDSPFNTYKVFGLPPAPICNPGAKSLLAAARPQPTDMLFYSLSPLLGRHRFAKTFAEHKHNNALAQQEREAVGEIP